MNTPTVDLVSLIEQHAPTRLVRVASTKGGEYAGPCPWCQGKDRFRVWPADYPKPRYWCRQCGQNGDPIQFLRSFVGLSYHQAVEMLGEKPASPDPPHQRMAQHTPPMEAWQDAGRVYTLYGEKYLASKKGERGRKYLERRGFHPETWQEARYGFSPGKTFDGKVWGLQVSELVIPEGILIPTYQGDILWSLEVRLLAPPKGVDPRKNVLGSRQFLWGADSISKERITFLYESAFDAASGRQEIRDHSHVSTAGATGCRQARHIAALAKAKGLVVAYDNDEPGDKGSVFWMNTFPGSTRWAPWAKDANDMLQGGFGLAQWADMGLAKAIPVMDRWEDMERERRREVIIKRLQLERSLMAEAQRQGWPRLLDIKPGQAAYVDFITYANMITLEHVFYCLTKEAEARNGEGSPLLSG